nr:immunoglobulin light chain junction region [Macaca mulatta]
CQQDYTTSWTF